MDAAHYIKTKAAIYLHLDEMFLSVFRDTFTRKWNEVPKWVGTKVSQVISFTHSFRTRQLCAQCKRYLHAKHFTMASVALWLSHWPFKPLSVLVSPRLIRCYECNLKPTPCIHMTIVAWDVKHKIIEPTKTLH